MLAFRHYSVAGSLALLSLAACDRSQPVGPSLEAAAAGASLNAPSGANATPSSSSTLQLTWTDNSKVEDGFRVERSATNTGPWETAGTTGPDATLFSDGERTSEQQVCYRVVAFKRSRDSGPSNTDCTDPPAAPTSLTATAVDQRTIDLAWKDNSTVEDGYEAQRASSEGGPYGVVANLDADAVGYRDTGFSSGPTYWYRVRAKKDGGFGDFSNIIAATPPPPAPGAIQVTTATTGFDLDVNGYFVRVDDRCCDTYMGANATITVTPVTAGDHALWLGHVATNCSVNGANPRTVSVASGANPRTVSVASSATTEVTFAVTCGSGPTIQVTTVTTGVDLDANGYGVMPWRLLDSWGSRVLETSASVAANGTVTLFGLITGEYQVEFSGIATNCSPISTNPLPVDLTYGGTVAVEFDVACAPIPPGTEACDNGLDDDGDGLTDAADPDCQLVCEVQECMSEICPQGYICGYDGCCVSHCSDGQRDGDEGDVDCGGSCAAKCTAGQHCYGFWDCASGVCVNDVCQP